MSRKNLMSRDWPTAGKPSWSHNHLRLDCEDNRLKSTLFLSEKEAEVLFRNLRCWTYTEKYFGWFGYLSTILSCLKSGFSRVVLHGISLRNPKELGNGSLFTFITLTQKKKVLWIWIYSNTAICQSARPCIDPSSLPQDVFRLHLLQSATNLSIIYILFGSNSSQYALVSTNDFPKTNSVAIHHVQRHPIPFCWFHINLSPYITSILDPQWID